jgi:hypothetical protein
MTNGFFRTIVHINFIKMEQGVSVTGCDGSAWATLCYTHEFVKCIIFIPRLICKEQALTNGEVYLDDSFV